MRASLNTTTREAIRKRRLELGYTQPIAADAAGVNITTWNGIEKGRSSGSPIARARMCQVLGWTVDSIDRLERGDAPLDATTSPSVEPDDAAERATLAERIRRLESVVQHLAGEQAVREWGNGKPTGR